MEEFYFEVDAECRIRKLDGKRPARIEAARLILNEHAVYVYAGQGITRQKAREIVELNEKYLQSLCQVMH